MKKKRILKKKMLRLPKLCPALSQDDSDPNFKHCWFKDAVCIHCNQKA
jgi:hypothetical protein